MALRPLFPPGYLCDTPTRSSCSARSNDPDILAMNGASAALSISDIPFAGPIGAVRVGRVDGEFVVNPDPRPSARRAISIWSTSATKNEVIMIEGAADEFPEDEFIKALDFAQGTRFELVEAQEELVALVGKEKREMPLMTVPRTSCSNRLPGRRRPDRRRDLQAEQSRARQSVDALREEVEAAIHEKYPDATDFEIEQAFDYIQKKAFRVSIMDKGSAATAATSKILRPLSGEVGGAAARSRFGAVRPR